MEKVAKDIEGKIRKQEDSLNYLKYKLSRVTNQTNLIMSQDRTVSSKYSKYI